MSMSDDQRALARMRVWERYEAAKKELQDQRNRYQHWQSLLEKISNRMLGDPFVGIEDMYAQLPRYEDFVAGIKELKDAKEAYMLARQDAKSNGFALD